jgi:hypothetical protein
MSVLDQRGGGLNLFHGPEPRPNLRDHGPHHFVAVNAVDPLDFAIGLLEIDRSVDMTVAADGLTEPDEDRRNSVII